MSSTKDLTPQESAFTADYLVLSGKEARPILLEAGNRLLWQAREAAGVYGWKSDTEESRATLETSALQLRQLAEWLQTDEYVAFLIRSGKPEAAFLRFTANAAGPALKEIAASFTRALAASPEHCEQWAASVRETGGTPPRPSGWPLASGLWASLSELEQAQDGLGCLDLLSVLTAGAPPSLDAVEVLQTRLADLSSALRRFVPHLRKLAQRVRAQEEPLNPETFPGSLVARMDGLLSEGLCKALVELEALQQADEDNPDPVAASFLELWRELDPGAPGKEGGAP